MSDLLPPNSPLQGSSPALVQRLFGGAPPPEIFANQMRMAVSVTDFTIVFGVAAAGPSPQSGVAMMPNSDKVVIHLAPGMLKQVLLNVEMAVQAYEEVMGTIRVPAKVNEQLATAKAGVIEMLNQLMAGETDLQGAPAKAP